MIINEAALITAAITSARLNPKVRLSVRGFLLSFIAINVIIIAIPSLKLCNASEIKERLPLISPPISSKIVIRKFNNIVIIKFLSFMLLDLCE